MTKLDRMQAEHLQRKANRSKAAKKQVSITIHIPKETKKRRSIELQGSIYKSVAILDARTNKWRRQNGKS